LENYICITVSVNETKQDDLIFKLVAMGAEGFEQETNHIKAYFKQTNFSNENVIMELHGFNFQVSTILPTNWNKEWESNFPMIEIDGICEIYASHHTPKFSQPFSIHIQPQMSFGTGHHATTQLMIKLIHQWNCENKKILDMGAGTGILGIFALKKNAKSVTFIDIEEWAAQNIKENIALNHLPEQEILCGNHNLIKGNFDGIFANINKNILLEHANSYYQHLIKNGHLFLSGFFDFDENSILMVYKKLGFELINRMEENGWIALEWQKL